MRAHTIAICNFFTKLANLHLHFLNFCKFCNFIYRICKLFSNDIKKTASATGHINFVYSLVFEPFDGLFYARIDDTRRLEQIVPIHFKCFLNVLRYR